MVFSFQLFCIAEEDTILNKCSWQQCVWSLCEKGFLAPGLFFCIFFLLPPCVCALLMDDGPGSHLWWHYWRSKKHCGSPRGKWERSCGPTAFTINSIKRWMICKLWKGCGLLSSVCHWFYWSVFTWADGMRGMWKPSWSPLHCEGKQWCYGLWRRKGRFPDMQELGTRHNCGDIMRAELFPDPGRFKKKLLAYFWPKEIRGWSTSAVMRGTKWTWSRGLLHNPSWPWLRTWSPLLSWAQ